MPNTSSDIAESRGKSLVSNITDWKVSTVTGRKTLDTAQPLPDVSNLYRHAAAGAYFNERTHLAVLGATYIRATDKAVPELRYYRSTFEITSSQETAVRFEIDPVGRSAYTSNIAIFIDGVETARISRHYSDISKGLYSFIVHSNGLITDQKDIASNPRSIGKLGKGIHEVVVAVQNDEPNHFNGFALRATPIPEPNTFSQFNVDAVSEIIPLTDFNGDGNPDFALIGKYGGYLFLHPVDLTRNIDVQAEADVNFYMQGFTFTDYMATTGDFNGDGLTDIRMAAAMTSTNAAEVGWQIGTLYGRTTKLDPVTGVLNSIHVGKGLVANPKAQYKSPVGLTMAALNFRNIQSGQGYQISDTLIQLEGENKALIYADETIKQTFRLPTGEWGRPIAEISLPAGNPKPTIIRSYANGLDAIAYGANPVISQNVSLGYERIEYITTADASTWSTLSAATRLDIVLYKAQLLTQFLIWRQRWAGTHSCSRFARRLPISSCLFK